jgi:hypothetical protein
MPEPPAGGGGNQYIAALDMESNVRIKIKQFILMDECPVEWKGLDLYLFRDEEIVFYVGQSYRAFDRIWNHLKNGYKARSDIGRFILCNWPRSMDYEIELLCSQTSEFDDGNHNLVLAEEKLIKQFKPCLNTSVNPAPIPLPAKYLSPSSRIQCSRSITKLRFQASLSIKNDEKSKWTEY